MTPAEPQQGYQVEPEGLSTQVAALSAIGESTTGLVDSANRLAERLPMLGTSPPAMHLAARLREAAGGTGLTGEVTAADAELNGFHAALRDTVTGYLDRESETAHTFRTIGGAGA